MQVSFNKMQIIHWNTARPSLCHQIQTQARHISSRKFYAWRMPQLIFPTKQRTEPAGHLGHKQHALWQNIKVMFTFNWSMRTYVLNAKLNLLTTRYEGGVAGCIEMWNSSQIFSPDSTCMQISENSATFSPKWPQPMQIFWRRTGWRNQTVRWLMSTIRSKPRSGSTVSPTAETAFTATPTRAPSTSRGSPLSEGTLPLSRFLPLFDHIFQTRCTIRMTLESFCKWSFRLADSPACGPLHVCLYLSNATRLKMLFETDFALFGAASTSCCFTWLFPTALHN